MIGAMEHPAAGTFRGFNLIGSLRRSFFNAINEVEKWQKMVLPGAASVSDLDESLKHSLIR